MVKTLPDIELLRELLLYCPDSGILTWKRRDRKHFPTDRACSAWNARYPGQPALTGYTKGYLGGHIFSKRYYSHRVAFAMYHGFEPTLVDHIDGDRSNNRIENLRECNMVENHRNKGIREGFGSGVYGVSYVERSGKWSATITVSKKQIYLGSYSTKDEAAAARFGAERALGFHANHGKRYAVY